MNKHHYHRFGDLVHEGSWTASWTTTSHGNTVSSDICESVILDFACRPAFVVSKSQLKVKRRLTLEVTRNWLKMRLDRESKVSRWPEHVDQLSLEFRGTIQTTDISTSLLMERQFVSRNIISIFFNTCSWSQYIMAVRSSSTTITEAWSLKLLLFMNIRDICSWCLWWVLHPGLYAPIAIV